MPGYATRIPNFKHTSMGTNPKIKPDVCTHLHQRLIVVHYGGKDKMRHMVKAAQDTICSSTPPTYTHIRVCVCVYVYTYKHTYIHLNDFLYYHRRNLAWN